jgi:hypothetical protein
MADGSPKEPRTYDPRIWCSNYLQCSGIGVAGFVGGGEVDLCCACEAKNREG